MLKAEVFARIRSLVAYDGGDWTEQERATRLRDFAARAGWDDPLMDEYDKLAIP